MSAPNTPPRFQLRLPVQPGDIDELDHVNNAVYLRWVQEAAVAHWKAVATAGMQAETLWVVLRHEIDYQHPALLGEEILVETWVGSATRITFERHTEIFRAVDRTRLAKARTLWCPINARTRRPRRVDSELRTQFSVEP